VWLERPDQWDKLVAHLRKAGEFGLDTETYNQPDKTSPQHRARVHCWSVGLLTDTRSPRGYRRAVGRVLPRSALFHPPVRELLADGAVRKWAHNAPHDRHSLENEGVEVGGLQDSLQWLRVACPGRNDYGLKGAEEWALGYPSRPSFLDVVSYMQGYVSVRRVRERGCVCGANPCRARSSSTWIRDDGEWSPHERVQWLRFVPEAKVRPARYGVTDFVPGANLEPIVWVATKDKTTGRMKSPPSWWQGKPIDRLEAWWQYSLADAVRGMELVDYIRNLKPVQLVYPWTQK
jgi:hypothetical protein